MFYGYYLCIHSHKLIGAMFKHMHICNYLPYCCITKMFLKYNFKCFFCFTSNLSKIFTIRKTIPSSFNYKFKCLK